MFELLTQVRRFLDQRREIALAELAGTLIREGASDEELEWQLDFHERAWEDNCERMLRDLAAWLGRGGQGLQ